MFEAFVYGLRFQKHGHPHDGMIRYVGKTVAPDRRFKRHMRALDKGHLARSVRKHGRHAFSLEILDSFSSTLRKRADLLALDAEVEWIERLQTARGAHGLNETIGGQGVILVGEALLRQQEASRVALAATKGRPEVREKCRALAKERMDQTLKAAMTEGRRRRDEDPVRSVAHRALMLSVYADPARNEKCSAAAQTRWSLDREGMLATFIAASKSPDAIARRTASLRRYLSSPSVRKQKAKTAADLHRDPEFREKYEVGLRHRYSDPELLAAHARTTRQRHSNPLFGLSARLGIALHWAAAHAAAGKSHAAEKQRSIAQRLFAEAACIEGFVGSAIYERARLFLGDAACSR